MRGFVEWLNLLEWLTFLLSPFVLLTGGVLLVRAAVDKDSGGAKRIAAGVGSLVALGAAFAVIGLWVWLAFVVPQFHD